MYRVTAEDMERISPERKELVKSEPYKTEFDLWMQWIKEEMPKVDGIVNEVTDAFLGVKLQDGIGLLEAEGISYYKNKKELLNLRCHEERNDWSKIPPLILAEKASALSFFDPKGFIFHLPAYLVAELRGDIGDYVILILIDSNIGEAPWMKHSEC